MAVMVWCNSCKKVVWAYDHQPQVDLRGLCNMLALPCPKCGNVGNFDSWGSDNAYGQLSSKEEVYDEWSAMKYVAEYEGVEWCPSGNNHWFSKELNNQIAILIKGKR